jgi:hypothetical protein
VVSILTSIAEGSFLYYPVNYSTYSLKNIDISNLQIDLKFNEVHSKNLSFASTTAGDSANKGNLVLNEESGTKDSVRFKLCK